MTEKLVEKIVLVLIALSFFVGIWNSFPMTSSIFDEMFSGGILRSMEQYSFLPQGGDIPYGTVTYFFSYPVVLLILILTFPFLGFDLSSLKVFIAENIHIVYLGPRLVSVACGIFLLFFLNKFLREVEKDLKTRLFLLSLLLTNILTTVIFHTAKVWVLSTFLITISFVYLYRILNSENEKDTNKYIFLSVLTSFLAFANFPLAGFSLINIPIIYFSLDKNKKNLLFLVKTILLGLFLFLLVLISNYQGVFSQVKSIIFDYTLSETAKTQNISIVNSVLLNIKKIIIFYPLFILVFLMFILEKRKIVNYKLFRISIIYLVFYFLIISFVARWSLNVHSFVRYLFPVGVFLFFTLCSFDFKFNWKLGTICFISVVYWVFTLYYLSVPTTYIRAEQWIKDNLNSENTLIINSASQEFDLPKNKKSYLASDDKYCASKCRYVISEKINKDIYYFTVNEQTKAEFKDLSQYNSYEKYLIINHKLDDLDKVYINSFTNNGGDVELYFIDSIGSYFDINFFSIHRLGKNIYIYKII